MTSRVYPYPFHVHRNLTRARAENSNSEPVGYASGPPFQPQYEHAQYAPYPSYGPTLTPADGPPSPGPGGMPHGVSSSQYPPATGAPYEPPVQTRALHPAAPNSRSHGRQPQVSAEKDASQPKRHDWRCHPHFKRSRCTGGRKALCVRVSVLVVLMDAEQGYR
jgi:hypothetical protein